MEERMALSRRLYRVLEEVGASEELRQLHRETSTAMEVAATVSSTLEHGELWNTYYCGSSYEGTLTPDLESDRDIIHCPSCVPVVNNVQAAPAVGLSMLAVRDSYTYPGYFKLQVTLGGQPQTGRHGIVFNSELDSQGRVCYKHIPHPNRNGPAVKFVDEYGFHYGDHVAAFRCETIPPDAHEWFQQQRGTGRPSQEQINAMSRMGCMFVGAGHVNSTEKNLEWRLSFSLQERLLISNLNPVQHKTYVLLKLVKKNILSAIFNDESLTSYHFKTCVLFAVQMTDSHAWTDGSLISCLLQCLKLMIKWLDNRNCPNYFLHEQNLFVKTGFSRSLMRHLLHVVRLIVETDTAFLSLIHFDNLGEMLRHTECRRYRELSVEKVNEYNTRKKLFFAKKVSIASFGILESHEYDPVRLASTLDILQRMESINEHTFEVTHTSLTSLYPWLHLHIAKGLVSLTHRYLDLGNHQQMMEMANFHFNEARDADLVNERLASATILFKAEKFDESFLLLQQVENDFIRHVTIICPCTRRQSIAYYDDRDEHFLYRKVSELPLRSFMRSMTASCVVFLPSELEITPVPLQHEMNRSHGTLPGSRDELFDFWFDWAVIDPRIYIHLMQYLVSSSLNNEPYKHVAFENLCMEIELDDRFLLAGEDCQLHHKETAYNVIGWIHAKEGRPLDAWRCFSESLKIRPCHNAAKFHVHDLISSMTGRRSSR